MIQRYCVKQIDKFNTEDAIYNVVSVQNFYANFDSGKAMVNTPVTFTAEADGGVAPFSYEFFINNNLVQERTEDANFTYTFDKAGTYQITVNMYNSFDEYETYTTEYTVVEAYTSEHPIISSIYLNKLFVCDKDRNITVNANAAFGTAPYQYSFVLDDNTLTQEFSENNTFIISNTLSQGAHSVKVSIKDSVSDTVVTETYNFIVEEAHM